ncbi:hypothetical protein K438DRAFT_1777556 [Mycena galopus ATCC 62051]|nr:hypothetical protein K438DRAFT_1777556 [Mycena galopus ATCC 62051]
MLSSLTLLPPTSCLPPSSPCAYLTHSSTDVAGYVYDYEEKTVPIPMSLVVRAYFSPAARLRFGFLIGFVCDAMRRCGEEREGEYSRGTRSCSTLRAVEGGKCGRRTSGRACYRDGTAVNMDPRDWNGGDARPGDREAGYVDAESPRPMTTLGARTGIRIRGGDGPVLTAPCPPYDISLLGCGARESSSLGVDVGEHPGGSETACAADGGEGNPSAESGEEAGGGAVEIVIWRWREGRGARVPSIQFDADLTGGGLSSPVASSARRVRFRRPNHPRLFNGGLGVVLGASAPALPGRILTVGVRAAAYMNTETG